MNRGLRIGSGSRLGGLGAFGIKGGGVSDTTPPTVAITSSESSPSFAATIPLTITFSESVTGFAVGDITVVGCTLGSLSGSGAVYTVNATPTASAMTVDIAQNVCVDGGGNGNTAATQFAMSTVGYALKAYWKLDETSDGSTPVTRVDSKGSLNLTDTNTCPSAAGIINKGASFLIANSERLETAANTTLGAGAGVSFECSFWVFQTSGGNQSFLGKNTAWDVHYSAGAGGVRAAFRKADDSATVYTNVVSTSLSVWHHFCVWHDSANHTVGVRIDDTSEITDNTYTFDVLNVNTIFTIGWGNFVGYMTGRVDEVGFWQRVLTSAERTWLYNSGNGRAFP